jgi:putative methionine-R-sulfoxide reductase with GAF domain
MGGTCSTYGSDEKCTQKKRDHSEDLIKNEKMISELISEKYGEKLWTGFIWVRRSCEYSNEPFDSTKGGSFLN